MLRSPCADETSLRVLAVRIVAGGGDRHPISDCTVLPARFVVRFGLGRTMMS